MSSLLITPVTPALKASLVNAGTLLDALDPSTFNDFDNYGNLVNLLDTTARSIMTAMAVNPLTDNISLAARFNAGPGTALAEALADNATYLREVAPVVLSGTLDHVTHVNCDVVWGRTGVLFNAVMDAIARIAGIDLDAVHGNGAGQLIDAATLLAQAANS